MNGNFATATPSLRSHSMGQKSSKKDSMFAKKNFTSYTLFGILPTIQVYVLYLLENGILKIKRYIVYLLAFQGLYPY
ncbi:MAG: hypothetical protein N2167_11730 [Flavobacteriales bacterium]|nr:hypothetical protein [Flavobacteriales bacterium]